MPTLSVRLIIGIGIGFVLSLGAQTPETFKVRLFPVPVDAQTRENIAGIGSATATLTGTKLSIQGSFERLRSAAIAAKVHQGPNATKRHDPRGQHAETSFVAHQSPQ